MTDDDAGGAGERVDALFRAWGEQLRLDEPAVELPDFTVERRRRSGRLLPVAAAAAVVVAIVATAVAIRATGGRSASEPAASAGATGGATSSATGGGGSVSAPVHDVSSGSARNFVVRDGDTVQGIGEVVALPGRPVRFCAPRAIAGTAGAGDDPEFSYCPIGLDVTGIDLDRLALRQVSKGVVNGFADLTGTYRHARLTVTKQRAAMPPRQSVYTDDVPCPAPTGGWPVASGQPGMAPAEAYRRAHPGAIVKLAYLNISARQSLVYVLTAGDPGAVRAALTPAFGKRLCVTRSDFSSHQIAVTTQILQTLQLKPPPSLTTPDLVGSGLSRTNQPAVSGSVPLLDPNLAGIIDAQPTGLVELQVWLTPHS